MQYKRILKYMLFFLLLLSLGFIYSFSLKTNKNLKVSELVVEFEKGDNNFLTHDNVNKLLIQKTDTLQNNTKSVIDLYKLENKVLMNPYVEKASVFLTIDGVIKSKIKQRTPVARIINKGDSFYVDKEGVKVPLSENYSARVLLISGINKQLEIDTIMSLLHKIRKDDFLKKEIVGIEKSALNEYSFAVRSGDYKIDFGNLDDMEVKFKKMKAFYNKGFSDNSIHNYKRINVKYHNQVVCTK